MCSSDLKIETLFGQQLVFSKVASSQQEQGLNSTVPHMMDQLQIRRNMNTGAISTSFPFTSADLTQEKGILYGINMHNQEKIDRRRSVLRKVQATSSPVC